MAWRSIGYGYNAQKEAERAGERYGHVATSCLSYCNGGRSGERCQPENQVGGVKGLWSVVLHADVGYVCSHLHDNFIVEVNASFAQPLTSR
jgi:hypothetical protein